MFYANFKQIIIYVLVFLVTGTGYSQTHSNFSKKNQASRFPQDKVDNAILKHRQSKTNLEAKEKISRRSLLSDSQIYPTNRIYSDGNAIPMDRNDLITNGNTLYVGPEADTLFIDSDYEQDGDIITHGQGVLLVDNAKLILKGHLNQYGDSKVILINGACLEVLQRFNSEFIHQLQDSASFESTNSTVDGKCVYQIRHYDKSQYIARQTHFTNWNFHKIWNKSRLILEDANMVGDLTVNDSCEVVFTRCDTILPWLGVREGDVVDYKFPPWDVVSHYVFDDNLDGINGINYSVTFDTCCGVMWGLESWEGSSIKIDLSVISIAFRLNKDVSIYDICDSTFYSDLTFPFDDRVCQITRSHLHMWFPYVYDNAVVHIDNCRYAESKAHNQSEIYVTNTISDGFPSNTSPVDSGFISFSDRVCRTFSSSWHRATLLLINTSFEPRPNFDASQNIAHGYANFLAVNCTFPPENEPWAVEAGLVMFAAIDSSELEKGESTEVTGSAWIKAGTYNPITFDRYSLYWSPAGDSVWTLIKESPDTIHHAALAVWNTSGLSADENYDLRLTIWDSAGDSLTAYKTITLQNCSGINKEITPPGNIALFQNYPNPFNPATTISYSIPRNEDVNISVYNITGQLIQTLVNEQKNAGSYNVLWNGKDQNGKIVSSGIYFYRIKAGGFTAIKRMLMLK